MNKFNLLMLAILLSPVCVQAAEKTTPVYYGGSEELDACSPFSQVTNLSNGPNRFLAVKSAPNLRALRIDKLFNGQTLWVCKEKGDWLGIVYTKDRELDCGVTGSITKSVPYKGPCKSGWVHKDYIESLAG